MLKSSRKIHESRAKELVQKMTLSEKVSQLRHHSKALKKYNIPEYNWWNECLHGVARAGIATVFPQAIAMAATFSDEILFKVAQIISTEARAKHHEFARNGSRKIYQGLTFWSPNINIYRDPRWGRGQETYGECPVLTAALGCAFVSGLQGDDDKYLKTSACIKHFAVHSGPEAERHSINVSVNKKDLNETYLYAFKSVVQKTDVDGVMAAYNMVNDESCCASKTLLVDKLREEWGFGGYVVSDCGGLFDIVFQHKKTINPLKAVTMALEAGLDLECGTFYSILAWAVRMKYIDEKYVDRALVRLLTTRISLGMFDDDCKYNQIPYSENATQANENYAIEVAEKGIVLLKNDNILPLNAQCGKVGLFGYNAVNELAYLGNYFGSPSSFITLKDAFCQNFKGEFAYAKAFDFSGENCDKQSEFEIALDIAKSCDYVIVATGLDSSLEGEAGDAGAGAEGIIGEQGDRDSIALPRVQIQFIERLYALGKTIIVCNFSGGAVSFEGIEDKVCAILQCWYPGAKGGKAIYNILFGEANPSGRLPVTFYKSDKDLGDFEDYSLKNRTYRYFEGEPMYSFGFGLSYSNFEYSDLHITKNDDKIIADFSLSNTSRLDGDEVCEVYIEYLDDDTQPKIKLLATKRVFVQSKAKLFVAVDIPHDVIYGFDENGEQIVVQGRYKIFVGGGQPKYCKTIDTVIDSKEIF